MFELANTDQIRPMTSLNKCILILQEGQQEQYYRPMTTRLDDEIVNRVLVDTNDGLNINPFSLLNTASTIIRPDDQVAGKVGIINGMNQRRYSYMMEFVTVGTGLGTVTEIVTGYTDTDQISASGAIAPELRFFVNDVITLLDSKETYIDRNGQVRYLKTVKDDLTLLRAPSFATYDMVSLRPEDVSAHKWSEELRKSNVPTLDARTSMSGPPKHTSTADASSHRYLANVLNSYFTAANPYLDSYPSNQNDEYQLDIHSTASAACAVRQTSTMFFHRALHMSGIQNTTEFTYQQVQNIWNLPPQRWEVIHHRGNRLRRPIEHSESWSGATTETSIVYAMTHLLPNIMGKFLIGAAAFTMTNQTIGREIVITPVMAPLGLFENAINIVQLKQLCDLIKMDIIFGIILPKVEVFDIYLEIDLTGLTHYEISVNGGGKIPFDAPMFCDGIYSPLIGMSVDALTNVSQTLTGLTDVVISVAHGYTNKPISPSGGHHPVIQSVGNNDFNKFISPTVPNLMAKYA